MQTSTIHLLRKLHRWIGLTLVGLICFYCFTGLLLNHRKSFDYFNARNISFSTVQKSETTLMRDFINSYKAQIGRKDDPTVIRIRNGTTIEFLYGSHGKTTYIINPLEGKMKTIVKSPRQPWNQLNSLHKVFKTSTWWLILADFTCLAILFITLTGLLIFRYRPLDWMLIMLGFLLPFIIGIS